MLRSPSLSRLILRASETCASKEGWPANMGQPSKEYFDRLYFPAAFPYIGRNARAIGRAT